MINKITLKAGSNSQSDPLDIEVPSITIFVGPNNAGKSLVLTEIEKWAKSHTLADSKLIDAVAPMHLTLDEVKKEIEIHEIASESGNRLEAYPTNFGLLWKSALSPTDKGKYIEDNPQPPPIPVITYSNGTSSSYEAYNTGYEDLIARYTLRLAGENRLNLLDEQPAGSLLKPFAVNYLSLLFRDNGLRAKVRQVIFDAIGRYFVIDPTDVGMLRVRLSHTLPVDDEEKSLDNKGIEFHRKSISIKEFSDGIRAFSGIIAKLVSCSSKIILIDEPEAYLHPALATTIGKEIGKWSSTDRTMRLFASTHSAAFLMGTIQSGAQVSIVRLTYKDGVATSRVLTREKLLHLMRNPMLRSTGVLDGLFFESVIVTEADADRAFYQEINERLRSVNDTRGISNCLFLNAQSKQTVWDIVKPLRELGIPTVGIVDLDMVKDGGIEFTRMMEGVFVPAMQHHSMSEMRAQIRKALDASVSSAAQSPDATKNWWKRNGGIDTLSASDRQAANNYFDQLEDSGAFVVRGGELEVWLKSLKVPANKKRWLADIFIAMGEDPTVKNYVQPGLGDVWDFIGRIRQWIDNPLRAGIPD